MKGEPKTLRTIDESGGVVRATYGNLVCQVGGVFSAPILGIGKLITPEEYHAALTRARRCGVGFDSWRETSAGREDWYVQSPGMRLPLREFSGEIRATTADVARHRLTEVIRSSQRQLEFLSEIEGTLKPSVNATYTEMFDLDGLVIMALRTNTILASLEIDHERARIEKIMLSMDSGEVFYSAELNQRCLVRWVYFKGRKSSSRPQFSFNEFNYMGRPKTISLETKLEYSPAAAEGTTD